MKKQYPILGMTAALALASVQVSADESDAKAPAAKTTVVTAFESTKTLSKEELGEQRAKARLEVDEVTINSASQDGSVAGNTALNNRTGGNSISTGAFVGASGFISSVQNTGNNVLIQNSTIINVSVEP